MVRFAKGRFRQLNGHTVRISAGGAPKTRRRFALADAAEIYLIKIADRRETST